MWIKTTVVCVNVRIVCVCMHVTACHNVGKAAYYTEGLYKNVFECIRYTADCVLRNIGTNA